MTADPPPPEQRPAAASAVIGTERILDTLAGRPADRVPFVPNLWQWFYVNRRRNTLPGELASCRDPLDVLGHLGADVFSKFDGKVIRPTLRQCEHRVAFEGEFPDGAPPWTSFADFTGGPLRKETIATPHGTLSHTWVYQEHTGAPFEAEHWWKRFEQDYAAVRAWIEDTTWTIDRAALSRGLKRVGTGGVIAFMLPPSPLKQFHWLAGPEQATFFLIDHPHKMQELAEIHAAKSLAVLERIVDEPGVFVFEVDDNLDSRFYSPPLFREYCLPLFQKMAALVHARGKYLFVHACGKLKALGPLVLEAGLDCVEGQAHPPIGDWRLDEARALSDRLILCGGMTATEQQWRGPDAARKIDAHVHDLFASLGDCRRFLFGSGCNTAPDAPYANLVAFRDAARRQHFSSQTGRCR